jgi:small subunit ribosomal protein S17
MTVNKARTREGVVRSNSMDKTVVVEVGRLYRHPKYLKALKRRVRYKAHDETNQCEKGDLVLVEETRPLSRTKRWRVSKILQRAALVS